MNPLSLGVHPARSTTTASTATHGTVDPLTGALTRPELLRALELLLRPRSASEAGLCVAVVLVHVRGIDAVNAALGHAAGDLALARSAEHFRRAGGSGAIVGRLDGTTFGVLFGEAHAEGATARVEQLVDRVQRPPGVAFDERNARLAIEVGVTYVHPATSVGDALAQAEVALEDARDRRDGYAVFRAGAHARVRTRRRLELELSEAASRQELIVHYQSVVDLRRSTAVGVEALVRWQHPDLGLLPPGRFIELAEQSGAIHSVGAWVLDRACAQAAAWRANGVHLEVGVNISPHQLGDLDLVDKVTDALARHGVPAQQVNLEVTESALLGNADNAIEALEALHASGVRLSLDDFGTGYSALDLVRELPIDVIKLDRTFVAGIAENIEEWALARAIVQVARSLDMQLLAEGVETPAQLAHLRALDADLAQGYLFSRPVDADRLDLQAVATAGGRHATT